jgi:hypothetical protein
MKAFMKIMFGVLAFLLFVSFAEAKEKIPDYDYKKNELSISVEKQVLAEKVDFVEKVQNKYRTQTHSKYVGLLVKAVPIVVKAIYINKNNFKRFL